MGNRSIGTRDLPSHRATVYWSRGAFYEELMERYSDAKVILRRYWASCALLAPQTCRRLPS